MHQPAEAGNSYENEVTADYNYTLFLVDLKEKNVLFTMFLWVKFI